MAALGLSELFDVKEKDGVKLTAPTLLRHLELTLAVEAPSAFPLPDELTPVSRVMRLQILSQREVDELPLLIRITIQFQYECLKPFESLHFYEWNDGVWRKLPGGIFEAHQAHIDVKSVRPILLGMSAPDQGELAVSFWCRQDAKEIRALVVPTACAACTCEGARMAEEWEGAGFECRQQCWPLLRMQRDTFLVVETEGPGTAEVHKERFPWRTCSFSLPSSGAVELYLCHEGERQLLARFTPCPQTAPAQVSRPSRNWARPLPLVPRVEPEGSLPEVLLLSRMADGSHPTLQFPAATHLLLPTLLHFLRDRASASPPHPFCVVLGCCCSSVFAKGLVESCKVVFVVHWLDHPQRPRGAPPAEVAATFQGLFYEEFERATADRGGSGLPAYFEAFLVARGRLPDQLGDTAREWTNPKQPRLRCWPSNVPLTRVKENPQAAGTDGPSSEDD